MFEEVAVLQTCAHPASNASSTAHLSPSSSYGSVYRHFADNVRASVRTSGVENEGSCTSACATSPLLVDHDRCFRTPKLESATGWSSRASAGFNGVSASSCPHSRQGIRRRTSEFRLPCSSKDVQNGNRHFGTQRHDNVPNASQWSQHRSGARFQTSARSATRSVDTFL